MPCGKALAPLCYKDVVASKGLAMRMFLKSFCAASCLVGSMVATAAGKELVAVVESVHGKVEGVEFMDYVAAGQVIKLGPKDSVVLGYLKSCLRETITGGTVIVLETESLVQLGEVKRDKVKCDQNRTQIQPRETKENAGNVFRSGPREETATTPRRLTLFGRSPIVEIEGIRGTLILERRDKSEQRIELAIKDDTLVRGRFLDLAKSGVALVPGGSYTATLGSSTVEFEVDADARPGATPVIGRLLRFD